MQDFALARRMMVDGQVRTFDVHALPVLAAMDAVLRERFVSPGRESLAYSDQDLPVSDGITGAERRFMLKPMFLGRLLQALDVRRGEKALDVACGLGYSAALLSHLGATVTALESGEALAAAARERLAALGIAGVTTVAGPLDKGFPDGAPYDVILVNGLLEVRPEKLLDQLADGGRLGCVECRGKAGRAVIYLRTGDVVGSRAICDAGAPALPAFKAEPGFVF
jgi:protein-L-isoaspartate(D-aspartate) O-methyltransferase